MMKSINFIVAVLLCLSVSVANAQEYGIGTETITDCGGFIVDNGLSASDYGPNLNLQSIICQDGSDENLVSLYFAVFDLGSGDELTIYDGNSTSAPSLGTFAADELQGLDITSTNPDGCLTLVFTSNDDAEVGNFGAQISCATPCERPYSIVTSDETEENPIRICVGEEIQLSGANSTFAEGMSLASWTWDFGDGETNTSEWPAVTHSFDTPGAYVIQLYLTDNNDCSSGNLPDKLVYVSTHPNISITSDDYNVCVGQPFEVQGIVDPVLWTALPTANFGGALYIPDDQTQCFSDTLLFGGFTPGSTIQSESDLVNFFINFEHSFMGDISITFYCPDGSALAVHQQGGGGTWLGEPIDTEEQIPGVGYDYYWTPTATNGTWADNAAGTLPAGTYESIQPFSNLIGCPLNGEWIVEICDMWGADNGFIFDWSVQFADYLYPELISFTPSFGPGPDSTYVSGPFITSLDASAENAVCVPTSAGIFNYSYTAIDDFGCTYTENINVTAYDGPVPNVAEDVYYCGTETQISGSVTNPVQGMVYFYSWSPASPLTNPNIPSTTIEDNAIDENTEFIFSVYPQDDPDCIVSDTLTAIIPPYPPSMPLDTADFCAGHSYDLNAPGILDGYSYDWYYAPFGSTNFSLISDNDNGVITIDSAGHYFVEIYEPICNFMSVTPYFIEVNPCSIKIPNIFTPNGNAGNDYFEIEGLEDFPNSTIKIYNRWGNLVYQNDNYKNNWSADDFAEGTYYYILGVNDFSKMTYYEGHVTLLRE